MGGDSIPSPDPDARRILLVEDDPGLARGLTDALRFEGYAVDHTGSGRQALDLVSKRAPDCLILDLMLPDLNGYQVCERVRATGAAMPIIMLTARSQEADKIRGLDAGADDYVTKPFSVGELLARIRAILRRHPSAEAPGQFTIGAATIDADTHRLCKDGQELELSNYELELLKLLWTRRGHPVSRDEILDKVWGARATSTNRTVDNFVVKLRRKIEPVPDRPRHILTVYGLGYKLVS